MRHSPLTMEQPRQQWLMPPTGKSAPKPHRRASRSSQDVCCMTAQSWQGRPAARLPLHPSRHVAAAALSLDAPAKRFRRFIPANVGPLDRPHTAAPASSLALPLTVSPVHHSPRMEPSRSTGTEPWRTVWPVHHHAGGASMLPATPWPTVRRLDAASVLPLNHAQEDGNLPAPIVMRL